MQRKYYSLLLLLIPVFIFNACQNDEYSIPEAKTELQNDCILRSLGPNVVGLNIEFVYAMALGSNIGKINSAQVEATIAGASGTYLENRSFRTNSSGVDTPYTIGNPSSTTGTKTVVTFTKDTCAAALRYYYYIPEEARGKTVSFTFSAKASTGEEVSYEMGPYTIAKMDMKLSLVLSDNNLCYFSVADMIAYTAAEAATKADKIDLVYLYRSITGITFAHALASPANTEYLPGITLPSGVGNSTKFWKVYGLRDRHLANLQYGIYVDDIDFQELDLTSAPNYGINMKAESGAWVETSDGKYRAYIYVNSVNNTAKTMTVSIKRYQMK
ncbi:MAG: DUF4466 domain-containing protein [Bacteroidetes bacterium GWF2_42_66]|nr:MAG: DUF4466 domain-containing protein [Bacteroidetes bacterium GWA2_42_15]OFX96519.1 MAG: DUF4466 domain-containing protein [Bacteroidetes bacterium GWE2_42_39]OFY40939.1 MAG: DUF4466 domain-containing protein [Bacteroidetes bacterium GWF2_42_66]HAZ02117.1 DUF4466 domain-containing protein [Marinilabiliales bacterium]HBL76376.1 DUF4466 domain-containing protein [Prolixibacteraceae bacterium]